MPPDHIRFFHSFEKPEAIAGTRRIKELKLYSDVIFDRVNVRGKTFIDVGAWDGYFSYEAERRGASDVLATDHFCWSGPGWGTKDGFDYIHDMLGSKARSIDVDVFDLDPAKHGTYDVSIMLGVIYHLTDPFGGLKKVAAMTRECFVVETHTDMNNIEEPVMRYYLFDELNGDSSNYWGPNVPCLENMLRELGFTQFDTWMMHPGRKVTRVIMHAWR